MEEKSPSAQTVQLCDQMRQEGTLKRVGTPPTVRPGPERQVISVVGTEQSGSAGDMMQDLTTLFRPHSSPSTNSKGMSMTSLTKQSRSTRSTAGAPGGRREPLSAFHLMWNPLSPGFRALPSWSACWGLVKQRRCTRN